MPTVNKEIQDLLLAKNRNAKAGLKAIKGVLVAAQKQVKTEIGLAAIDSWDAFHLPQLLDEINRHIATFGTSMESAMDVALENNWDLGVESVNKTLNAAGELNIGNFFIPKTSLEALKNITFEELKGVTSSARTSISRKIANGILTGKSPREVSFSIGNVLGNGKDLTDRSIWAKIHRRANVITNTEMGRVLSVAADERLQEAGRHVQDLKKRWIHAGHPKEPRTSHVQAEFKEPIPVKEPFNIGGVNMMFPRDPAAPLDQVISCGCIHVAFKDSWKNAGAKKLDEKKAIVPAKKPVVAKPKQVSVPKPKVQIKPKPPDNNLSERPKTKPIFKPPTKPPKGGIKVQSGINKGFIEKAGKLTSSEKSYLDWYSGDGFRELNDVLRNPSAFDASKIKSLKTFENKLNSAINKRIVNKDFTAWRGVNSKKVVNLFNKPNIVGKKIPVNSFQSTALNKNIADFHSGAGGVNFKINVKKGTNTVNLLTENLSRENIAEVVIPNRGEYIVKKVSKDGLRTLVEVDYVQ